MHSRYIFEGSTKKMCKSSHSNGKREGHGCGMTLDVSCLDFFKNSAFSL